MSRPRRAATFGELYQRLDPRAGDSIAKRSAFWIILTLSSVIAVSGPTNALSNSQVLGRTSPTLLDLTAALATGLVGVIAMIRRDVGDVLPGVAIVISLVPPLGVAGVCLGSDAPDLALGALVLFGSNMIAMIISATVILVATGCAREAGAGAAPAEHLRRARRRPDPGRGPDDGELAVVAVVPPASRTRRGAGSPISTAPRSPGCDCTATPPSSRCSHRVTCRRRRSPAPGRRSDAVEPARRHRPHRHRPHRRQPRRRLTGAPVSPRSTNPFSLGIRCVIRDGTA